MPNYFYGCTSLTGGGDGALDALTSADLQDGDGFVVITDGDGVLTYHYDASSFAAESSPGVIAPNDIGANPGRFILQNQHSKTPLLQGGTTDEYYHLTSAEYTELSQWLDDVTLAADGTTTLPALVMEGNITMPDGGTIGQVAGPLLTFDDTGNDLEITGCDVGIGVSPSYLFDVLGGADHFARFRGTGSNRGMYLESVQDAVGGFNLSLRHTTTALSGGDEAGRLDFVVNNIEQVGLRGYYLDANSGQLTLYLRQTGTQRRMVDFTPSGVVFNQDSVDYNFTVKADTLSAFFVQGSDGLIGANTLTPRKRIDSLDDTNAQLRLTQADNSVFCDFHVDSSHDLTIKPSSTGQIKLQPTTDSTDFFQVLDADGGTPVLNVDTVNERIGINRAAPQAQLHVAGEIFQLKPGGNARFILGDTTSAGDWGGLRWDSTSNYISILTNSLPRLSVFAGGNVCIGTTTFGTNAAKTIAIVNGTAPTTDVADQFAFYGLDIVAGNSAPHFRTEAGQIIKLYQQAHIVDADGTLASATSRINAILGYMENLGFNATV